MKILKNKVRAIWRILTCRNCILVYGIQEFSKDGEAATRFAYSCRTDFTDEKDFLVVKGTAIRMYNALPAEVKADNHL
jgi:hypothetical protein